MAFTTRHSVLEGIRNNSEEAWNRFFSCYIPLIRMHGHDCGITPDSIDDLVQEVLLAVSQNRERFHYDSSKGHFRNYLRRIIRNKANDFLRDHYRQARLPIDPPELEKDPELDAKFDREWQSYVEETSLNFLRECVSPRHYQLYELYTRHRKSPKYIASFLNIPLPTVYSTLKRTEEKLRGIADRLNG